MTLTPLQRSLHESAIKLSQQYKNLEYELVGVLGQIDREKLFKKMGYSSLFLYAVQALDLSEPVALSFIATARKCETVPALSLALKSGEISVARASRIISVLKPENAAHLIEFAKKHSRRETDREVAKLNPKAAEPDRMRPLSEDLVKLEMTVRAETFAKLERVKSLLASKGKDSSCEGVLDAALELYLDRHDPVRKAERWSFRRQKGKSSSRSRSQAAPNGWQADPKELCPDRVQSEKVQSESERARQRVPLTAEQEHAVAIRDGGRCTFTDASGKRCNSDLSHGGGNEPENLTTLCSYHHDMVHQLSLPIDGQVTWLRSPVRAYG